MRENPVRRLWQDGKPAFSGWCSIGNSFTAELMAGLDFDAVCVDGQHGLIDFADALGMFQAISTTRAAPFARVSWNDPAAIMRLLDAGAYGVICPMINTPEQCQAFVGACRYPPAGYRSLGPTRASVYGGADYFDHANREIVTLAMIETREALANVAAIAATPGLDGLFIGPGDLAVSLGQPPSLDPTGETARAVDDIVAAARKANCKVGIYCASGKTARKWFERGFDFIALGSDVRFLLNGAAAEIKAARGG